MTVLEGCLTDVRRGKLALLDGLKGTENPRVGSARVHAFVEHAKAPEIRELFMTKWQQLPEGTTPRELVELARELAGATAL